MVPHTHTRQPLRLHTKKNKKELSKRGKLTCCVVQKSSSIVFSSKIPLKALVFVLVRVALRSAMFATLSAVAAASLVVFLVTAAFIFEIEFHCFPRW